MITPVVFLDIDGVLNTIATPQRWPEGSITLGIDPRHAAHLVLLLEATGARVVISSAWRIVRSLGEIKRALHYQGNMPRRFLRRVVDRTPSGGRVRGEEIQWWLMDNGRPPYVILDDSDDMLPEQLDRFVQVLNGLGPEETARAIQILK